MEPSRFGEYDERLNQYLRLASFPVAVRFLRAGEEPPARARRPRKDLGNRITICQAIALSRRYGWTVAMDREDSSCVLGAMAVGMEKRLPYYEEGNLCLNLYNENLRAGALSEQVVPRFTEGEYAGVATAPLARASFTPHTIVIYGNSAQVMRLGQAWLWKRGGSLRSEFRGRIDCADLAVAPLLKGEPQLVVPCSGDRIFAQVQDHEMAFGFPFGLIDELLAGLEGTHKSGTRYPVTNWLNYTGGFPATYETYRQLLDEAGPPPED